MDFNNQQQSLYVLFIADPQIDDILIYVQYNMMYTYLSNVDLHKRPTDIVCPQQPGTCRDRSLLADGVLNIKKCVLTTSMECFAAIDGCGKHDKTSS